MNIILNILLWFAYLVSLFFGIFWLLVFLLDNTKKTKTNLTEFKPVTVMMPCWNKEPYVAQAIDSVLSLNYPDLELIVVEDKSDDNTLSEIKKTIAKYPNRDIKLIVHKKNLGKGHSMNEALKIARGTYIVNFDADSIVEKDALLKLLPEFKENVAAVLPAMKVYKPKNLLQKMQWYEYILNLFYKEIMSRINCVHVAPGPFSIYKTDILRKVGGFDASQNPRNLTEDLEIALRLQSKNYILVQSMAAEVRTFSPDNIKELYAQRNRWYKGSILNAIKYKHLMFNKKYGDFGMIQMPTIVISGVVALILIGSIFFSFLKSNISAIKNLFLIKFDLLPFLKNFTLNFNFLDLNYTNIFVAVIMLSITAYVFYKSHTFTNEKIFKQGIFSVVFYTLMYFLILSTMWIGITFDLVRGKTQKW